MSEILELKTPGDSKPYKIEWASVLTDDGGVAISSSSWVSSPAGLTLSASISGTKAVVWVSGGQANVQYTLTNTMVTDGGTPFTHARSIIIPCYEA